MDAVDDNELKNIVEQRLSVLFISLGWFDNEDQSSLIEADLID